MPLHRHRTIIGSIRPPIGRGNDRHIPLSSTELGHSHTPRIVTGREHTLAVIQPRKRANEAFLRQIPYCNRGPDCPPAFPVLAGSTRVPGSLQRGDLPGNETLCIPCPAPCPRPDCGPHDRNRRCVVPGRDRDPFLDCDILFPEILIQCLPGRWARLDHCIRRL